MSKLQIGFWSDATAHNPFQALLYSERDKFDYSTKPLLDPFSIPDEIRVVHLHWIEGLKYFYGKTFLQVELFLYLGIYRLFKEIGPKRMTIVTIHNLKIHDDLGSRFQNRRFMRKIINKFDLVHFLSIEAYDTFTREFRVSLSSERVYVGKHPNYSSTYPESCSEFDLRASLHIPQNRVVIGYVGSIKPYKNLGMLVDSYLWLKRDNPDLYLFIAGSNYDKVFHDRILGLAECDENIKYIPGHLPDGKLASYVKMLDVAVFPFKDPDEILNSGSLILSLSFCVHSIVPNFNSLSSFSKLSSVTTFQYGVLASLVDSIQLKIDNHYRGKALNENLVSSDMSEWLEDTSPRRVSQDFFSSVKLSLRSFGLSGEGGLFE